MCKVANCVFIFPHDRTRRLRCLVPSSRSANCRILESRVWLQDSLPVRNPNEVYLVSRQQNIQASNLLRVPELVKSAFVSAVLHSMRLLVPALPRLEMITVHFVVILLIKPKGIQSSISPGRSCRMGRKPPWPCCDDGFYESHREKLLHPRLTLNCMWCLRMFVHFSRILSCFGCATVPVVHSFDAALLKVYKKSRPGHVSAMLAVL